MTHFGNESLKITVVRFLFLLRDEPFVYSYFCLCYLICFWNSALFILKAHVSHFCSDQKNLDACQAQGPPSVYYHRARQRGDATVNLIAGGTKLRSPPSPLCPRRTSQARLSSLAAAAELSGGISFLL